MGRVSLLTFGLLFLSASAHAQNIATKPIGSGGRSAPIINPISSPPTTTAPTPNPLPITTALGGNGDAQGCDTGCAAPTTCLPSCGDCCPDRTLRVFGGWNLVENMDARIGTGASPAELDFNPGWALGGAIGKYMTCNLRRELEFTYRQNTPAMVVFPNGNFDDDIEGSIRAYSVMGNLVYEAPHMRIGKFQPYAGTGIGIGVVDANMPFGADTYTIDDAAIAYQGFVGFQREVGSRAKVFAEYRMFGTDKVDIVGPVGTARDNYLAHNVLFGLQFNR
jgi:opacity protein-like surface antigen